MKSCASRSFWEYMKEKMAVWSDTILVFKIIKTLLANINNSGLQLPACPDTVPMQIILTTQQSYKCDFWKTEIDQYHLD